MLHYSCDLCQTSCTGAVTRRWEHINADIGLEVIILKGDKPQGDIHLCDECILKMFLTMLERLPTGLKSYKHKLDAKEQELHRKELGLESKEATIKVMKVDLDQKISDFEKRMIEFEENKFNLLKSRELESNAVIEMVRRRESEAIRQAEARGKQLYIDELNAAEDKRRGRV